MDGAEIDAFLREQGFGVLTLAANGAAYPVPMSFGYDGDRLYFVFVRTAETSTKLEYGRKTETAAFLVYDVRSKHRWRSAVVYGDLGELPEEDWDDAVLAVEENAWHPNLFASAAPTRGIQWWELDVDEATGRKSTEYE